MRSDKDDVAYERVVKLWISLWHLVLENKRNLQMVAAKLQYLVFEMKGFPEFKQWEVICKVGETDPFMMMALATLDMMRDDDRKREIVAAFPDCFGFYETHGPYPLSMILADAEENGRRESGLPGGGGAECPVAYGAIPADVPLQGFDKFGNRSAGFEGPILPKEIDSDAPQGSTIEWMGKKFVVLENNYNCEELWIAPAECIRVDL